LGVIDPRLAGRYAEKSADRKTADKTRDETIASCRWAWCEIANGHDRRCARQQESPS